MSRKVQPAAPRLAPALALVLALAAGCGNSEGPGGTGRERGSTVPAKVLTKAQLEQGLLAPDELPTGYTRSGTDEPDATEPATEDPDAEDPDAVGTGAENPGAVDPGAVDSDAAKPTSDKPECADLFERFGGAAAGGTGAADGSSAADGGSAANGGSAAGDSGAAASAASVAASVSAAYEKSEVGPEIEQELTSYADLAKLKSDLGRITGAVDRCSRFVLRDAAGEYAVTMVPAPFPPLGEESAALKIEFSGGADGFNISVTGYVVAVRVGATLSTLVHIGPESSIDAAETEKVARTATNKLTQVSR